MVYIVNKPKILFFAGSAREKSLNKYLARAAFNIASASHKVEAKFIDLKDFSMPIYDGDLEEDSGLPKNAVELKKIFLDHDALFIASPEYNSSFTPLLKNSLDWISRPHSENEARLSAFQGKVVALAAASPGGFGGLRALVPLRMMLGNISTIVIPEQLAISSAHKVFDADSGELIDEGYKEKLENLVASLVGATTKLTAASLAVVTK